MIAGAWQAGRRAFAARVALLFATLFAITGIHLPFLPVWLDALGLGAPAKPATPAKQAPAKAKVPAVH